MKNKLVLALVVLFVFEASAVKWENIDPSDIEIPSLKERQIALNKFIRDNQVLSLSELYNDDSDDVIPIQFEITNTDDQSINKAEILFNNAELNILRDNEESSSSDKVHKKEDQKVGQEKSAQISEALDDDDGEEDKEEDIEEEEERYDDDTAIIRSLMIKNDSDVYLQSFVIFISGFVLGGAISFFFMSIKNRYRDLKEAQLVLEP
ncbi:hypothetical protein ACFFRR_008332 [Megaselia abdita]